jgi:hypothetical protein
MEEEEVGAEKDMRNSDQRSKPIEKRRKEEQEDKEKKKTKQVFHFYFLVSWHRPTPQCQHCCATLTAYPGINQESAKAIIYFGTISVLLQVGEGDLSSIIGTGGVWEWVQRQERRGMWQGDCYSIFGN